jgi:hypothetical protein
MVKSMLVIILSVYSAFRIYAKIEKNYVLLFGYYLSLFDHNPNIFSVVECYHSSDHHNGHKHK